MARHVGPIYSLAVFGGVAITTLQSLGGHKVVLRAALGSGPGAVEAYRAWRASVLLDDIDWPTFRLLPLLDATAKRHGIEDVESKRIEGAAKHIWLSNTFRLNSIITAVEALNAAGISTLLLKGAALFARDASQIGLRATGDYDLLVQEGDKRRAIAALSTAGFRPVIFRSDRFADRDFEILHAAAFDWGEKAQRGQIDLHWKPSGDFPTPGFAELLFSRAEVAKLGRATVMVPSLADHVFLGLVHATKSIGVERVDWFVEAAQILQRNDPRFDWDRISVLCRRYEFNRVATTVLSSLNECVPGLVPAERIRALAQQTSVFERIESRVRASASSSIARRLSVRMLDRIRATRGDRSWVRTLCTIVLAKETWTKAITALVCAMPDRYTGLQLRRIWHSADRHKPSEVSRFGEPEFPIGWSGPEESGRWSVDRFQLVRLYVPTPAKSEVLVRLQVRAFIPDAKSRINVALFAGVRGQEVSLGAESNWPSVVAVPALVRSNGTVAIALKVLNPVSPAEVGLSDDPRALGLFVERVELSRHQS